jgi:hypothetical protein
MSTSRRSFLPLALITLGVVFLLGNLLPGPSRGGLIVLGIGTAFLIGRITTGRYGYAVPAGILIGIGSYLTLRDMLGPGTLESGGWWFICLGLGFALTYVIGGRASDVWPLFPASVLILLGLVLFGFTALSPLASLAWIVSYWPVVLVLVGAWLLFREYLPQPARQPVALFGGLGLLAYGVLAAASTVAAGGAFVASGFGPGFGGTPYTDTIVLEQPILADQTFRVSNPNGRTTIRTAVVDTVHVEAARHFGVPDHPPEVKLVQRDQGLSLEIENLGRGPFGGSNRVEFDVVVPATVRVDARSSSGNLDIDGVGRPVRAESSSGSVKLTNLGSSVEAEAASGAVSLENVAGEVRARTNSGNMRGLQLRHVREASSSSGNITLEGVFADPTQVRASSGDVELKILPGSAAQIEVKTSSGRIAQRGVTLANQQQDRRSLTGTLGTPAEGTLLQIQTSSGNVLLTQ